MDIQKIQNVRPIRNEANQQDEAVHGHAAGQDSARGGGVFAGQSQKDRAATQRIHDGKQRAENQQDTFGGFEQRPLREKRV